MSGEKGWGKRARILRDPSRVFTGQCTRNSVKLPGFVLEALAACAAGDPGAYAVASSRRSQARAMAHSRFTVATEMPATSAVSSSVRPPK
jgi:hypothetical protein